MKPIHVLAFSLALPALLPACDPAARQKAGATISTLAPALCATLSALTGANGETVGLVCADVAKGLGAALQLARADTRPTMTMAAGPLGATCEPLMLVDLDPSRDPREYVCKGALSDAEIRKALGMGHAK